MLDEEDAYGPELLELLQGQVRGELGSGLEGVLIAGLEIGENEIPFESGERILLVELGGVD